MKKIYFLTLVFCLLLSSCIKKYKNTTKVCNDKLFVEVFNVNPAGVDSHYLTDSLNFRLYVGKVDNEHENFSYICDGDSIRIGKLEMNDTSAYMEISKTKVYSLSDLKRKKVFE